MEGQWLSRPSRNNERRQGVSEQVLSQLRRWAIIMDFSSTGSDCTSRGAGQFACNHKEGNLLRSFTPPMLAQDAGGLSRFERAMRNQEENDSYSYMCEKASLAPISDWLMTRDVDMFCVVKAIAQKHFF